MLLLTRGLFDCRTQVREKYAAEVERCLKSYHDGTALVEESPLLLSTAQKEYNMLQRLYGQPEYQ